MSDTKIKNVNEVKNVENSIVWNSPFVFGNFLDTYDRTGIVKYLSRFISDSNDKNTMIRISNYLYESNGYYFQSIENSIAVPDITSLIIPIPKLLNLTNISDEERKEKIIEEKANYSLFLNKLNHSKRAFECLRGTYKHGVSVSFIDIKNSKGKEKIKSIKYYSFDVSYIDIIGNDGISNRVAINMSDFYGAGYTLDDIPKTLRNFIIKSLKRDNRNDLINPTRQEISKIKEDKYRGSHRVVLPSKKTIVVLNGDSNSSWGVIPSLLGAREIAANIKTQIIKSDAYDNSGKTLFSQTFPKTKNGDKSTMTSPQQAAQHEGLKNALTGETPVTLASLQPETQLDMFQIMNGVINVDDGNLFSRQGVSSGYATGLLSGDVKTDKVAVELNKMIGNKMHILLKRFADEINRIYNSLNSNNEYYLKMEYVKNNDYIKETNSKWADKLYTNGSGSREHYYAIASGMDATDYMHLLESERLQGYRSTYLPNPTAHTLSGKDSDNLTANSEATDKEDNTESEKAKTKEEEGDIDE